MNSPWPLRGVPTRRELLQRGGLLAGALALGAWAAPTRSGAAAATAGAVLSEDRRQIFTALAETVVTGPGLRLSPDATAQVVSDFESAYVTWASGDRHRADALMDALGRDFTKQARKERSAVLHPGGDDGRSAELAYRARSLVAIALTPDDALARPEVPA